MKKVLFLTHENPQGYRIQQYFPYLEERGFEVTLKTNETSLLRLAGEIRKTDVLYIQRLLFDPLKLSLIRRWARRIVYDFDDAVMYGTKGTSKTRQKKFKSIVEASDVVFCGNHFLMEEAARHRSKSVFYVPTVVDTGEYPVKTHREIAHPVAGWIGSTSTLRYISDMKDLIVSILKETSMEFTVIADSPPDFSEQGLTFVPWKKENEKQTLLSFDAGIMPLRDDIWSRGKCGLKLIQYMASGLPSVASSVGAAEEIISEGVNGFLASEPAQWKEALMHLALDVDLRKRMGAAARETAEDKYSLKTWGPRVAHIIDNL